MLVVDASVVVKAIVAEDGSSDALRVIGEPSLVVPAHCLAEVGEALVRKIRSGQASPEQVARVVPALRRHFPKFRSMVSWLTPSGFR